MTPDYSTLDTAALVAAAEEALKGVAASAWGRDEEDDAAFIVDAPALVKAELARLRKHATQMSDTDGFREKLKRKHEIERYEQNVYYPTLKKWCEVDSDIRGIEADMERRVSWLAADGVTWKRGTVVDLQAPAREKAA